MSLLILGGDGSAERLAQQVYAYQFAEDPRLESEYDSRRKRRMLEDIRYNLEVLATAVRFDTEQVMVEHARWIYGLLAHRMKDIARQRVAEHMVDHYRAIMAVLNEEVPAAEYEKTVHYLTLAIDATEAAAGEVMVDDSSETGVTAHNHRELREAFIELVLSAKRDEASRLILGALDNGLPLADVYLDVFQPAMYKVGELWHQGSLAVDKEHYFTAVTQSIMTQLYPRIFSTPRSGRTVLACCVGNELHEMGIRMVCDMFEVHGWDSIYLGAALPEDAILRSIEEHSPDLVALSVTMPHHLPHSHAILQRIREHPQTSGIKVALGGQAFRMGPYLPRAWGADYTSQNAERLVQWANAQVYS